MDNTEWSIDLSAVFLDVPGPNLALWDLFLVGPDLSQRLNGATIWSNTL